MSCLAGLRSTVLRSPFLASITAALVLSAAAGPASARTPDPAQYPVKTVRLVAPFSAGGALDMIARSIAESWSRQFDQPFIVDNRAGAAGIIGSSYVANATPDGYTLLLGSTTTHGINPSLYKTIAYSPDDFAPISLIATIPHVLVVNPTLGVNSLPEFIEYVKANPNSTFGSAGIGSPHHLVGEMLKGMIDVPLIHVPYKGSAPALGDLMGGQTTFVSVEYSAAAPYIDSGRLKAIAIAAPERVPGIDVATYTEQGLPLEVTAWYAVYAPAGTPPAIVEKLSAGVAKAVQEPELQERLRGLGAMPVGSSSTDMATFQESELARWRKAIQDSGATAD